MKELFGALAVLVGLVAYAPYLMGILQRRVHPHPYGWFAWGVSGSLSFSLLVAYGAGAGAWPMGMVAALCFTVAALAWRMDGAKRVVHGDIYILFASLGALALWTLADQPTLSMLLLVFADILAMVPTVRKTWKDPSSEAATMWAVTAVRYGFSFLALGSYTLLTVVSPITWTVINLLFCAMILVRRRTMRHVLRRARRAKRPVRSVKTNGLRPVHVPPNHLSPGLLKR